MTHSPKPASRTLRRVMIAAVVTGLTAVAVAEQVVVRQDLEIKSSKDALADPVTTVPSNTTLTVVGRDGGWIQVQTPDGKVGYISQDDLPANANVAGLTGNAGAGALSTSAAGKGLEEDAEHYAASKNLNKAPLNQMISWGDAIKPKDLREFDKDGNVGPKKYRH